MTNEALGALILDNILRAQALKEMTMTTPTLSIYAKLTEAAERVSLTQRVGDEDKWREYNALSKPEQLQWRLREGHREYTRLNRLSFHSFI